MATLEQYKKKTPELVAAIALVRDRIAVADQATADEKAGIRDGHEKEVKIKEEEIAAAPGPFTRAYNRALKEIGVQREKYQGGIIQGNGCKKLLSEKGRRTLIQALSPKQICTSVWSY